MIEDDQQDRDRPQPLNVGPATAHARGSVDRRAASLACEATIPLLSAVVDRVWHLRPYAYRALDRDPLRGLLGRAATLAARREAGEDVEILWDGTLWMFRVGDAYIPGEAHFVYRHGYDFARWPACERALTEDLWFHVHRPQEGAVVIDGGAGIGGETEVFARAVGPRGRVLSIEANPGTFARLQARIRWNRLDNVVPFDVALVDRRRRVYIEDRDTYERNTVSLERRTSDLAIAVEGISIDELCAAHAIDDVDFLKLNIEGAEQLAIEGMRRTIRRIRAVCIACHGRTREPVVSFLREAGFAIVTRDDDDRSYVRDHVHGIRG